MDNEVGLFIAFTIQTYSRSDSAVQLLQFRILLCFEKCLAFFLSAASPARPLAFAGTLMFKRHMLLSYFVGVLVCHEITTPTGKQAAAGLARRAHHEGGVPVTLPGLRPAWASLLKVILAARGARGRRWHKQLVLDKMRPLARHGKPPNVIPLRGTQPAHTLRV